MRANVKPLTYWLIHNGYTVRFRRRSPTSVQGVISMPAGEVDFDYDPVTLTIQLPDKVVTVNRYGWETETAVDKGFDRPATDHDR